MAKSQGRPTSLSQKLIKTIGDNIRLGATYEVAAVSVGVRINTLMVWKARGKKIREVYDSGQEITEDDKLYLALVEEIEQAKAVWEISCLEVIDIAAKGGTWAAAAWELERMKPERYGKENKTVVITDKTQQEPQGLEIKMLPPDIQKAIVEFMHTRPKLLKDESNHVE